MAPPFQYTGSLQTAASTSSKSFWRLQIYRILRRFFAKSDLLALKLAISLHFLRHNPYPRKPLDSDVSNTSLISYHREPATALTLNCDRSLQCLSIPRRHGKMPLWPRAMLRFQPPTIQSNVTSIAR